MPVKKIMGIHTADPDRLDTRLDNRRSFWPKLLKQSKGRWLRVIDIQNKRHIKYIKSALYNTAKRYNLRLVWSQSGKWIKFVPRETEGDQ